MKNLNKKTLSFLSILFFVLFSLGQLQRIQLSTTIAFYLHDLIIIAFIPLSFIFHKKYIKSYIKKAEFSRFSLELFFIGWFVFSIVSNLIISYLSTSFFSLYPIFFLLRLMAYIVFSILLSLHVYTQSKTHITSKTGYTAAGIFIMFWGFIQYFLLPDTRFLSILGWDDHYYRLISTIFDPAFTGMIFVLTFLYLQKNKLFLNKKIYLRKYSIVLIEILLIIATLLTFSRASYLALIISIVGLTIINIKNKPSFYKNILYLILFILLIPLLPKPAGEGVKLERTSTVYSRVDNMKAATEHSKPLQLVIGKGLIDSSDNNNSITITANHSHIPDNLFILIFSASGIIGLITFTIISIKWMLILLKTNPVLFLTLLATAVHSMFSNTLLQPFVFLMLMGGITSEIKTRT